MTSFTTTSELAGLLSRALGNVKAAEVVRESLKHLGFTEGALSRDQAVQALEAIAKQPGIVGISARFALSRLLLKPGNGP